VSEDSPLSPEARAHLPAATHARQSEVLCVPQSEATWFHNLGTVAQLWVILRRIFVGVYSDGFVLAGNFAYLSLVSLFAFCIVATSIAGAFGQSESGAALIQSFFQTVPKGVADALREPIQSAMMVRNGPLLWFGVPIALWTTASLIESFRDVLHRAYGTNATRHFWEYRAYSLLAIIAAVLLAMIAFSAQLVTLTIEQLIFRYIPAAYAASGYLAWGKIIPFLVLFISIYIVFRRLTPEKYASRIYPKWPGAAWVSLWWLGCTTLLPIFLAQVAHYSLTYGSLAGVMVALIFFYLIGLGLVIGAQVNAALANEHENVLRRQSEHTDRVANGSEYE
jgi:membrane protein